MTSYGANLPWQLLNKDPPAPSPIVTDAVVDAVALPDDDTTVLEAAYATAVPTMRAEKPRAVTSARDVIAIRNARLEKEAAETKRARAEQLAADIEAAAPIVAELVQTMADRGWWRMDAHRDMPPGVTLERFVAAGKVILSRSPYATEDAGFTLKEGCEGWVEIGAFEVKAKWCNIC